MPEILKEANPLMTQDTSAVTFCCESLMTRNGRKAFKPDRDGYYCGVPVAAIGTTTRLQSYYDTQSMIENIQNDKTSHFALKLKTGSLYGEWGHPELEGLPKDQYMSRIVTIKEVNASHHFRKVYNGPTLEKGGSLIVADLKPVFGRKNDLKDTLEDPNQNTSFSLRSLTKNEQRGPVSYRRMLKLVTFDFVLTPGFSQASKGYAPISTESLNEDNTNSLFVLSVPQDGTGKFIIDEYSQESFSDTELNEILGTNHVKQIKHYQTLVNHTADIGKHTVERAQTYFRNFLGG